MRPFRCQICGETYLGFFPPDRCPFCGVPGNYLLSAPEYIEYGVVELSEQSKDFCRQAMETETSNVAYYLAVAAASSNQVVGAIFKRIAKHESEHLSLIFKMCGLEKPPLPEEKPLESDAENMAAGHAREDRAIKLYTGFAREAPEGRMKEVFRALADIEKEHYKLYNIYR
ncbi:MAG: rubrerythrin [Candidatus Aureabacteria bacterium]|nr:rubrerythrin [Candidatus Auribacterota bacterium]